MRANNRRAKRRILALASIVMFCPPATAEDYPDYINEEYLRSKFSFGDNDSLKYSRCEQKSQLVCTYVWGPESNKDSARIKAGVAPAGDKLQLIYAQGTSGKDFERVVASYSDAQPVADIGNNAVWSDKRSQLSFITETNLIVHVYIEQEKAEDTESKAIAIANDLSEQL